MQHSRETFSHLFYRLTHKSRLGKSCTVCFEKDKSHEEISRGKNRGYVSLSSTTDELLRDNSSRSKSRRVVNRALAALPWSRPILCKCVWWFVGFYETEISFMYASTKHLRPVDIPYSLRRRVWCAL